MKTARLFSILTLLVAMTSLPVFAQGGVKQQIPLGRTAGGFEIKAKMERPESLPSPQFSINGVNKKFSPKEWFSMEVEVSKLGVKDAARRELGIAKDAQFISPVDVTFYIHFKSIEDPKKIIQLQKTVTYLNVPLSEPTYFSVYISPSTIKRLFNSDRFNPQSIERVGFEMKYKGEIIYRNTKPFAGYEDWWNIQSNSVIKDSNSYPLLSKDETPFSALWWDRYPEVKAKGSKDSSDSSSDSTFTPPAPPTLGGGEEETPKAGGKADGETPETGKRKSRSQQRREENQTGFNPPENN